MSGSQKKKKNHRHTKRQTQLEKTAESDSDMSEMLELSDWEFKSNMTNTLKIVINRQCTRKDGQKKQRYRNPKKESKDILEIKNSVTEMENIFGGLICRLDMVRTDSLSLSISHSKPLK